MTLLAIAFWQLQTGGLASPGGLGLTSPLVIASCIAGVVLLVGVLLLVYRERAESLGIAGALAQKSAELHSQTETAVCLAREVETARAEMQRINEVMEGRVLEGTSDLRTSKTALHREIVERQQVGASLRESESNLLIAREEFQKDTDTHTEELERSNRELEQFAYVASHDLQEPLRAIAGCVQILERRYKDQLDARGHELIAHTVEGVARLRELIEGLLAYSRVGRADTEMEPVSLEDALAAARQHLEWAITETSAIVEHEALPIVCGNRGQLVQLFQNLIGNALKYRSATAPRIRISAQRDGETWTIAIRDNGIGIEAQYFDRVFSIFQRLHTRDEYPGTGIGLAICKRIVEQAGGAIWIESELGVGSTFYFTLSAVGT